MKGKTFILIHESEKIKQERENYYAQKLLQLKSMNAANDVAKAVQSNNFYLLTVLAGRGTDAAIPGLLGPRVQVIKCNLIPTEGMGDILYGKNHLKYRQEMVKYMREFNALMQPNCN